MKRYHQALCEENQNDKNNSTDSTKNDANGSASILLQTPNVEWNQKSNIESGIHCLNIVWWWLS